MKHLLTKMSHIANQFKLCVTCKVQTKNDAK